MTTGNSAKQAEYIELAPGDFLWLDDPEIMLQISSGTVDVYAVASVGTWQGQKIFLFEAGEGQTLFGLPPAESKGMVKLLVLAPRGAIGKQMARSQILAKAIRSGEHILEAIWFMLEEWLEALLSAAVIDPPPRSFISLEVGESVTVQQGQKLRPQKNMIWVQVKSGDVRYGPLPEYVLTKETDFPLMSKWWLTAADKSSLRGLATEEVFLLPANGDLAVFWEPLARCHQLFSSFIELHFATAARRDSERLAARGQLRERLLYGAANHLLRTDMPELAPAVTVEGLHSPLLMVVRAVASYLGVAEQQVTIPLGEDPLRQDMPMLRSVVRLAGMQVRQVCLEPGWQRQDNGPLIGFRGPERRMVAILPVTADKYRLFDPGRAETVLVREETTHEIEPIAYTVYAGLPKESISVSGLLSFMAKKCWPGDIWAVVFISLIAGIIPILTPFVTQTIFEHIIPNYERQGLVIVVQVMMVAAFATAGVAFARGVTFLRVKNRSHLVAEAALWLRLLSLPVAFFRRYEAGDLAQRMHSVSQIFMLLSNASVSALFNTLFSFWSLLVMLYYSWKLTLVAGTVWIIYLVITVYLQWCMVVAKRRMMAAEGETAGQVLQIFNGLSKFRMQGAEAQAFYLWSRRFGEQWKWNRDFRWKSNWLEIVNTLQPVLLIMLVFWLTMRWLEPEGTGMQAAFITLPEFMGFNSALVGFNATLTGMITLSANLLDIVPQVERLRPILEAEPEIINGKAEVDALSGQIEISNVSFRYGPDMPPVLRNISMNIHPGQFVAIVGASGSGKSTLLRLLLGFEKPETGSIYYDGQDLAEVNVASVRAQMGVVLQNGQMMAGDILSNIIGSLPLTIDDAWQAAEMVGLAEDIQAMPMGMNTLISEGASNISGGQRQRILIARSIVHRPRLIMFDEATSALDNRTQAIVTESLDRLNATRIVVAHRLSTVINADIIYVLDKGEIVERGTYSELMAQSGLFAILARRQMA
ncbi:NHLP bacteriocin export ABC transporter permease/ATPase subunit [Sporomusa sp. KB1]|jgi:ATP-binding cassette subfamily C protein|uniref:NHLP bacteriocin export ABC transporter permease/ATPase subunit n=1 Tax=Sporomusa sp. KB1 TaxID=943346 RepID=UPI0011A2DFC1|nr:NHLP bacteriocin export ABC transporter permease/ATPase subunit [Sporomusa sp. KB1]TWH51807.1 ATP-binding cassette subfamily C protein [Sporomusa sp. KB1]